MNPDSFPMEDVTFVNPLGLLLTLTMCVLILVLPRRWAIVPIAILTCFMTMGMRIVVFDLDFVMLRVLILFGWMRLILRGEVRGVRLNTLDKVLIAWVFSGLFFNILLWGTFDAFISRLRSVYNALGLFFLFRFLIRDLEELKSAIRTFAVFVVPLAGFMLIEKLTGTNVFAAFGGVPETTKIRAGVLRCQGPFSHPILAGTFGAALLPLFFGLWQQGRKTRLLAGLAIVASMVITVTAGSSGPVFAVLAGMVALAAWMFRKQMRLIRWSIFLALLGLHLVMKAPVWALMGRVPSFFTGSTGWHRAMLITQAVDHFGDWWLMGDKDYAEWSVGSHDVTNHFLAQGWTGGLVTLLLFVGIVALAFQSVGRAVRALSDGPRQDRLFVWSLGAALFTHVVNFLSVSYFDQNIVNWFLLLAGISLVRGLCPAPATVPAVRAPLRPGKQTSSVAGLSYGPNPNAK